MPQPPRSGGAAIERITMITPIQPAGGPTRASCSGLGPTLAAMFADPPPTVVLGLQSRGSLLVALVAVHLQIGLVEVRKEPQPSTDSDQWLIAHTHQITVTEPLNWVCAESTSIQVIVRSWSMTGSRPAGKQSPPAL
jgi:hypothetical protein